ncbi:MAG: hypothetical protein FK734_21475 [Asgard group archaeon]|nr:hypothetical protein [Asgard group archaeon]
MSHNKLSQPYSKRELLIFIRNHLFGPWKKYQGLTNFIPKTSTLNTITPKLTLGFIGDIMSLYGHDLKISKSLRLFLSTCDYLIGNFEGLLTTKKGKALFSQVHTDKTLETLIQLIPKERIILCCANNHSADFGSVVFEESYQYLKDYGFQVIGKKDEPSLLLHSKVNLVNATFLSNKPQSFLSGPKEISDTFISNAAMNFLLPHWGYELQLYPHPIQVIFTQKLLETWDAIIGHHSHNPQIVSSFSYGTNKKMAAFSLGNYCFGLKNRPYHQNGIVLKLVVGPEKQGKWSVGSYEWSFIQQFFHKETILTDLIDDCKFFDKNEYCSF